MYDIQENGGYDITIDDRHVGSVYRSKCTGLYSVCILLGYELPTAPEGLRITGNSERWAWQSTQDTTRDDALRIAHEACQALVAMRAVDTATDAGHVPHVPTRAA